jgi:spore germination protein KC
MAKPMKRRLILGIMIVLCFIQSGCWSRKELSQISIVMAAAIDQAGDSDKLDFTVQVVNLDATGKTGGTKGGAEQPFYVAASSGFTLADAERNLYKHVTRPILWQHMRVIIISEELARTKLASLVDYLDRTAAFRHKMLLLVTPGKARETLTLEHPVENLSGQAIYNLVKETLKHSEAYYPSDINDFLIALSTPGIEPLLARLEVKQLETPGMIDTKQLKDEGQMVKVLELSGSAVFKAEKMVGWLNDTETKGLLWVQGKTQNTMLILNYPGSGDQEELITILNQRTDCQIRPEFIHGKPRVTVAIKAEGRISGQSFINQDSTQTDIIKSLDRQYAAAIKREIMLAFARAQGDYDSDIFGFGLAISRKYPGLWRKLEPNWDQKFRYLKINLKVTAHIRRMGLTLKPPQRE